MVKRPPAQEATPRLAPDLDALQVKKMPVSRLIPFQANPRRHPPAAVQAIVRSMESFGWTNPILVQKGTRRVIAGHGRLEAAKQAGILTVPIIELDLTDDQATAYTIADNQIPLLSEWDEPALAALLAELKTAEVDLSLTGFEEKELARLLQPEPSAGLTDPDALPENVEPMTKPGDVWALGEHRVVCGDATKQRDPPRAQAVITDPPFGVRDEKWDSFTSEDEFRRFTKGWLAVASLSAPLLVSFFTDKFIPLLLGAAEETGWAYRRGLVWRKPPGSQFAGATRDGFWYDFEFIQVFGEPAFKVDRAPRMAVLEHRTVTGQEHGCEKPVALLVELIEAYSQVGHRIFDPFLGSGTTLIAAEQLGRVCHGIEISEKYCDVSISRWEKFTGRSATRL